MTHIGNKLQDGAFEWGVINSCWIFQIAGFAPTRLIIFVFRLVIDQYFQSGILFISAGQSGDGRQVIMMIRRVGEPSNLKNSARVYNASFEGAILYI